MKRKRIDDISLRRSKRIALQNENSSDEKKVVDDESEDVDKEFINEESENDSNDDNSSSDDNEENNNSSNDDNSSSESDDDILTEEDIEFTQTHPDDIGIIDEEEPHYNLSEDDNVEGDELINNLLNENKMEQNKLHKQIREINNQLKNKNLSRTKREQLEKTKFDLEEMDKFDTLMNKVGLIVQESQKEIDKLDEKLDEKKIEKIETDTLEKMEKMFNEHKSQSEMVNKMKENIITKDLFNINGDIYKNNKINFNFWMCYGLYGLPDTWLNIRDYNDTSANKSKIDENYSNVKKYLVSRYISAVNILELDNITIEERTKLMELFVKLYYCKKEGDIYEFMKVRDKLREEFDLLKTRNTTTELEINRKYLQEIKTIKNNVEDEIFKLNLDPVYKKIIHDKYTKMINLSKTDSDRVKMSEWLELAINLPYNKSISFTLTDTKLNILKNIKNKLDEKIYGLDHVKEEILIIVNSKLSNPYSTDNTFCLCAAPGYGKTKIIKLLSEVLLFPFYQISMGGINDVSLIEGHSYTYVGSKPGKITSALKHMKFNNGILYFDEIDKISKSHHGQDVSNALLHITDTTQNMKYYDKYLGEIPIDLSKLWFIFSCNKLEDIDPILLNRIKRRIILPEYKKQDKINIMKKLLPEICSNINLNINNIIIPDDIISHILDHIKIDEPGMRTLIGIFESVLKRLKLLLDVNDNKKNELKLSFYIDIKQLPYIMNMKDVDILLKDLENKDNSNYHHMYI